MTSKRRRLPPSGGDGIDLHVGNRLKQRRLQLALSVEAAAQLLEIVAAEYLLIEAGEARLTPRLLYKAAVLLEVPLAWFFDGGPELTQLLFASAEPGQRHMTDQLVSELHEKERLALLEAHFVQLSPKLQIELVTIARILAEMNKSNSGST
jgi:transcriptional regulator with XRE-family HTH domain